MNPYDMWRIASRGTSAGQVVEYKESRWEAFRLAESLFDSGAKMIELRAPIPSVSWPPSDGESSPPSEESSLDFAFLDRKSSPTTTTDTSETP